MILRNDRDVIPEVFLTLIDDIMISLSGSLNKVTGKKRKWAE